MVNMASGMDRRAERPMTTAAASRNMAAILRLRDRPSHATLVSIFEMKMKTIY